MITFQCEGRSVTIRNPLVGNTRRLNLGTTVKMAMDGTRWAYTRPLTNYQSLPVETLTFNFEGLGRSKVNEIMQFKEDTMAKTLTLLNYDGTVWIGVLLNDPLESTHDRRRSSSLSLTFQGHYAEGS